MNDTEGAQGIAGRLTALLTSPVLTQALAYCAIGLAMFSFALRQLFGLAGMLAILVGLLILAAASLSARRSQLEWTGLLPITLLSFVGWSTLSLIWSTSPGATIGSVLYQWTFGALAVFVAISRDLIQIVRSLGGVLRLFLAASLLLEFLVGILLDASFPLLAIDGTLAEGGPIQGLAGDRGLLGLIAVLGLVAFLVELLTRSVPRSVAWCSLTLATAVVLLTRSPVVMLIAVVTVATLLVLLILRRAHPAAKPALTMGVLALVGLGIVVAWMLRERLLSLFQLSGELTLRLELWQRIWPFAELNTLEGWGWVGAWRSELAPYFAMRPPAALGPPSAASSFIDAWLQLGLVGLVLLSTILGFLLMRAFLLAVRQHSVPVLWPALTATALLVTGVFSSALLVDFGWFMLVLCVVVVSRRLSWRIAFERAGTDQQASAG